MCVRNAVSEFRTGWTRGVKIRTRADIVPFAVEYQNDPGARSVLNPILTPLLSPRSRVLLEKLTDSQLVKNFSAFYGTRRFITAFTIARHLSLSWARSIQSTQPHPTYWRSILIVSSHLHLGLPSCLFPQVSRPEHRIRLSFAPYALHVPPISFFSILSLEQYWAKSTDGLKTYRRLIAAFSR